MSTNKLDKHTVMLELVIKCKFYVTELTNLLCIRNNTFYEAFTLNFSACICLIPYINTNSFLNEHSTLSYTFISLILRSSEMIVFRLLTIHSNYIKYQYELHIQLSLLNS